MLQGGGKWEGREREREGEREGKSVLSLSLYIYIYIYACKAIVLRVGNEYIHWQDENKAITKLGLQQASIPSGKRKNNSLSLSLSLQSDPQSDTKVIPKNTKTVSVGPRGGFWAVRSPIRLQSTGRRQSYDTQERHSLYNLLICMILRGSKGICLTHSLEQKFELPSSCSCI